MYNDYYGTPSYGYNAAGVGAVSGFLLVMSIFLWIISIATCIIMIISMWKIFTKCGEEGWKSLIPVYNIYVMTQIAGVEWWYILLLFVPFANIYSIFVIYNGIAKKFGKSTRFTIGMMLLSIVFFPMLAFGKNNVVLDESANMMNQSVNPTSVVEEPVNMMNQNVNPTSVVEEPANMMNQNVNPTSVVEEPVNMMNQNVNPTSVVEEPVNMMNQNVNPTTSVSDSNISNEMDQLFDSSSFVERPSTNMQNNNSQFNGSSNNGQM